MSISIICILFLYPILVNNIQIPFINNATFIALSNSNTTIIFNQTCNQCLCMLNFSYLILNCFPNNTCQFFNTFPYSYTIQSYLQARIYFLQQILPTNNNNQCCMMNTTYLINKLNIGNRITTTVLFPICLLFDNHGYLVTASRTDKTIVRFYPTNLTIVNQPISPIFSENPMTINYYNQAYYISFQSSLSIVDSNNLTILKNLTSSYFNALRDVMMLNNGEIMVVVSSGRNSLLFFNRSADYSFIYERLVNQTNPHGLKYVNDSFFYLTSWSNNAIHTFSAINNNLLWRENLFINAKPIALLSDGNHVTIDECDRYWFSIGINGLFIFNNQGMMLGNLSQITQQPFDTMLSDNYVIYLSDISTNQIIRIDPNIEC